MKRFFLIALMAITAVALVTAPGWAAGARMLSDRQLDNVHAGDAVSDVSNSSADSSADSAGDLWIAGAASSAAAAVASDVGSAKAVKINNKCDAEECRLKVNQANENNGGATGNNAQSILNTVVSVNAVQINVASAGVSFQENRAYTADGVISEIDSFEAGNAAANSAGVLGSFGTGTAFASADSSASAATSASSALAFATPRVEVKNRCAAIECQLKINDTNTNTASTANNAQSILNTVASVNAVQMNVAGGAAGQTNIAFSTVK